MSDAEEINSTRQRCRPTWTHCCRLLQACNSLMLCTLIGLVVYEYLQIETLDSQLAAEQDQIASLQEEVREKQEVQIEELHQAVEEEQDLTIYILAGTFTLLTCLISMFHMSTHLQKMNQPIIQRKIVAILWMSPIYSVTSFLSLIYPPSEGYFAIVKDFYESYCIYTFLSFLIAVLGRGDRDQAVEVLAKHANHLHRPARCLSLWFDPPPETSDKAKANAVITECQILAMQFVFIRPLTSVIYVIYTAVKHQETGSGLLTNATMLVADNVTRWLQQDQDGDWRDGVDYYASANETFAPTSAPMEAIALTLTPSTFAPSTLDTTLADCINATVAPSIDQHDEFKKATIGYFTSLSFVLAMIVNVSICFAFAGLLKFYHAVREDLQWCRPWPKFVTIKGVVFLTFWQGLAILIFVYINSGSDDEDPFAKARRYQNILICLEMLFFSISHWCVFPAEEWEKDYQRPEVVNKPGIGIQDFVSDVGYIVQNGRSRRKARRRRIRRSPVKGGFYHHPAAIATTLPDEEDYDEQEEPPQLFFVDGERVEDSDVRARAFSDSSSAKADDEFDDLEML